MDSPYAWVTYASLIVALIVIVSRGLMRGEWSKTAIFFEGSNAVYAFIISIILVGLYFKPDMAIGAINDNPWAVTIALV